jgi:hypothetical protein
MPCDVFSRLTTLCICLGWSVTAWAASSDAVDLLGLPWLQIGLGISLAMWGGLLASAQRLKAKAEAGEVLGVVWPVVVTDVMTSGGAGFLMYGLGAWANWDRSLVSVLLFAAGYAGTRLLEPSISILIDRAADFLRQVGKRAP